MRVDLLNGRVLAYIGDSVMTLKVREYLVESGLTKAKALQSESIKYLSAKGQAAIMAYLLSKDFCNEDELKIYHLGRNYKANSVAKNVDVLTYRIASGYEALWGYLHISENFERLEELWQASLDYFKEPVC
ncbi:MAG: Mini-ribonuclease 3 [Erysipelotrichaceae bacterium]